MIPFQTVLDAHGPHLYRHLVGVLGPHDGADCYQETVIAALRAWPPQHDGNLRAWLFTVAHRKVIDQARARGRRPVPVGAVPDGGGGVALADVRTEIDLMSGSARTATCGTPSVRCRRSNASPSRSATATTGATTRSPRSSECSEAAARQSVKAGLDRLKEVLAR